ncbi:little elongation complex subunit 1-like isoform X1 [Tachysurus ichikawai]
MSLEVHDLAPSNPREALETLTSWQEGIAQPVPPAVTSCITQIKHVERDIVMLTCHSMNVVFRIIFAKSRLTTSQETEYLGLHIDSMTFCATQDDGLPGVGCSEAACPRHHLMLQGWTGHLEHQDVSQSAELDM